VSNVLLFYVIFQFGYTVNGDFVRLTYLLALHYAAAQWWCVLMLINATRYFKDPL
jgi:hypothetical protein